MNRRIFFSQQQQQQHDEKEQTNKNDFLPCRIFKNVTHNNDNE